MRIADFMRQHEPGVDQSILDEFEGCQGQSVINALVRNIGSYESWTFYPSEPLARDSLASQVSWYAQNWERMNDAKIKVLVEAFSVLDYKAAYYLVAWIEHRARTHSSPTEKMLGLALEMIGDSDDSIRKAGKRFWDRMATTTKLLVLQGVILDSIKQKVMTHD